MAVTLASTVSSRYSKQVWFVVCGLWLVVCGLWFVVCACVREGVATDLLDLFERVEEPLVHLD